MDIVCKLLETPFRHLGEEDKRNVVREGRPAVVLSIFAKKEVKKSGKMYNVNFKDSWFSDYKWMCSSEVLQRMFCWPCLLFSYKNSVWNRDGFTDLLNITRALHKHQDSAEHLKCELLLRNFEKDQNDTAEVDPLKENERLYKVQFNEKVRLNRLFLHTVIDAVLYLSGCDDCSNLNQRNFKELLGLLISRSPLEIRNHYESIKNSLTGDMNTIHNELISCISNYINDHINKEIQTAEFFSVQVDDFTNASQTSQCSLIVRFVNSEGTIVERFLGFHDVSVERTSETLYNMLDKILDQFDYKNKLIGQCYDGACVTSGNLNGLQEKIKEKSPQAVLVHCLAHRLNLLLQQSFKKISKCRLFFASLSEMSSFFRYQRDSRWSSSPKLVEVIVQDWDKLKEAFEFITTSEESDKKSIQLARGFLNDLNDFEFTFLSVVFEDIFGSTEILCDVLQKNSLDVNFCITQIKQTRVLLCSKRSDEFFDTMFDRVSGITEINVFKWQYAGLTQEAINAKYKQIFYEILDHILMELDIRFQDFGSLQFVCLADPTKFAQYNTSFPSDVFENLQQFYGKIFAKSQRLKNELVILYAQEKYRNISQQELLIKLNENKDVFMEAYKLFSLILTFPFASASAGTSFSCLRRIKTYSRNRKSQERLSSLANISIQNELVPELMKKQPFYEDIIDKFAALKDRKIDLIYNTYNQRRSSEDDTWRSTDEARQDSDEVNVKYEIDFADVDSGDSHGIPSPLLEDEPTREDAMLKVEPMSKIDPIATYVHSKDECSTFGEHVANKLRNLSERYRAIAEHRIINAIFEVEMDQYNASKERSSDCYSQPSSTSRQNASRIKRKRTPSTSSHCPSLEAEYEEMQ